MNNEQRVPFLLCLPGMSMLCDWMCRVVAVDFFSLFYFPPLVLCVRARLSQVPLVLRIEVCANFAVPVMVGV